MYYLLKISIIEFTVSSYMLSDVLFCN